MVNCMECSHKTQKNHKNSIWLYQIKQAEPWQVETLEKFSPPHLLLQHGKLRGRHGCPERIQLPIHFALELDHDSVIGSELQLGNQFLLKRAQGLLRCTEFLQVN